MQRSWSRSDARVSGWPGSRRRAGARLDALPVRSSRPPRATHVRRVRHPRGRSGRPAPRRGPLRALRRPARVPRGRNLVLGLPAALHRTRPAAARARDWQASGVRAACGPRLPARRVAEGHPASARVLPLHGPHPQQRAVLDLRHLRPGRAAPGDARPDAARVHPLRKARRSAVDGRAVSALPASSPRRLKLPPLSHVWSYGSGLRA